MVSQTHIDQNIVADHLHVLGQDTSTSKTGRKEPTVTEISPSPAVQRYSGWVKSQGDYERLMERVLATYTKEASFKMVQEQMLESKRNLDGYGCGKAEGYVKADGFKVPEV